MPFFSFKPEEIKSRINQVRYAALQSVIFIFVWNPYGLCNVIHSVLLWYLPNLFMTMGATMHIVRGIGLVYTLIYPLVEVYFTQPYENENEQHGHGSF